MAVQTELARAGLRAEVRDFCEDYAACLDDMRLDDWPAFFTDDALYRVISKENFDAGFIHAVIYCDGKPMILDRVLAVTRTLVYQPRTQRRFISGVRIDRCEGDTVFAQANFLITQCMLDLEPQVVMAGRYVDELVRQDDGTLLIRKRSCVYDNFRVTQSIVIPV